MTLLNTAGRIYLGGRKADAVYAGTELVWPQAGGFSVFDEPSAANVSLSGGGLIVTNTASGMPNMGAKVVPGKMLGTFYYEATLTAWATGGSVGIGGVGDPGTTFNDMQSGSVGGVMLSSAGGQIWSNFTIPANIGGRSTGDVIGFAIDLTNRLFWCRLVSPSVGLWNGVAGHDPTNAGTGIPLPTGSMTPFCTFGGASTGPGNKVTTNFGAQGFFGAVPIGFIEGWPL